MRLLVTEDPRWWVAIGASIGFGMLSKWTMGFFVLGIVAGVLFTDARRYLKSKWLWIGVALSILIWLPNLLWQAQHHFISLDFLSHIHARDIRQGRTEVLPSAAIGIDGRSRSRWPWPDSISAWSRATASASA